MNDLTIFKNSRFGEVRTTFIDGEPYLLGKGVAEILGYKNTRDALLKHVDDEDKTTRTFCPTGSNYKTSVVFINESGLYSLILRSKLPQAKEFKRWVTSEVLPAIRNMEPAWVKVRGRKFALSSRTTVANRDPL